MDGRKLKKVKVAMVGYGARAPMVLSLLLEMDDVEVVGVCDLYPDRAEAAAKRVEEKKGKKPVVTLDYGALLEIRGLNAVITPSGWTSHMQICLDAMNAGLYASMEVGGAASIQQCWDLVRTSEKTGMPCMLMENCCYGRQEMTILNMAKKGLFGELVHAEGGYRHDLRDEICLGEKKRHYRLANYLNRNGELYPTHELGPIAKYLNLNKGNRMLALTSMSSKSCGLEAWVAKHPKETKHLQGVDFAEGDVVVTNIKCAHGEVITLFHDTSLPRPYSRGNLLQGTAGIWSEDKNAIFIDGISEHKSWTGVWDPIDKFYPKYEHPLWKKFRKAGVKGGHGGMDFLVLRAFIQAVKNRTQTPIDVYDAASWMAITALSEESVAMGGHPVAIPDFTDGKWILRQPDTEGMYSLDKVCKPDAEF